jgi:ABC-2 type transport system permease protein
MAAMSAHAHAGRRGYGPSALGDDLRRFVNLTVTLAWTDFKLRFFGSVLGYLWTLMRPLMLFGVLYLVFTHVVKFGGDIQHYPVYLLAAIVMWTFFAEATVGAVTCLVNRESLLRKIRFPRMVIPLSVALTALMNFGFNLLAVIVFAIASGVEPRAAWLELPLLVVLLTLLATGVGMLLSALYVRYRDIQPIWEVVLQMLFYGSPILYVAATLPNSVERIALANPLASIFTQMRHAFIDADAPSAAAAIGGTPRLLIPLGLVVLLFLLGLWVFNREAPRIAENL